MTRYDPSARSRLARLLEAGEALRATAEAYGEALNDAPLPSAGLSVGLHEVDDEGETAKAGAILHAEFLADLVERLTRVVDVRAGEALGEAERAALATLAPAAPPTKATRSTRGKA